MRIIIINGPNLNLLGTREQTIYGTQTMDKFLESAREEFTTIELDYYQSNVEGEIINKLHEVGFSYDGIILNAGGYTHTSVAIADAVASVTTPVVEVHLSNPAAREDYRKVSLIASKCKGIIAGFGMLSYELALHSFIRQIK
jgi:3-dehydroquinate dehydratase II